MIHRGPDSSGIWISDDSRVGFGHRRLSIIDLSATGNQPMFDAERKIVIILNGEIYNYKNLRKELISKGHIFKSSSDTETIILSYKEWGVKCVDRFVGMFAFALYDLSTNKVFIARDRAGEKPLYYYLKNNQFIFSSEIKGILSNPSFERYIDYESLDLYLNIGFVPGERSILKGINKLPPAHAIEYDAGKASIKIWRYWDIPKPLVNEFSHDILIDEIEKILSQSISDQLHADVPVGILLSGGVDSSLITAIASKNTKNVKTFNISFPQFNNYDESKHALLISKYFGTEHFELSADDISPDIIDILSNQYDEPIADSSMIPTYLVTNLISKHCKVALGGDGGDEVFGGYTHYNRLLWMDANLNWIPGQIRKLISATSKSILPISLMGKNWIDALQYDLKNELPLIGTFFDIKSRKKLIKRKYLNNLPLNSEKIVKSRVRDAQSLLHRSMIMDFENYMAEDILVKIDRASMLNSIELRAPFLDHRLIEYAFKNIPSNMKATSKSRKIILKKLAKKLLPDNFDIKRKQGFSIPFDRWLKEPKWKNYFMDILMDNDSLFNKNYVEKLFKQRNLGLKNNERLFNLVILEKWRKDYNVAL